MSENISPKAIQIRNAHVHNLKNIDVDPAGEDRGDCGGVRVGEIFPGAGRFVCGGL